MAFFFQPTVTAKTAAALLAITLIGLVDFYSGIELDFSIFYLLPIYWIAWTGGLWPGMIAAVAAETAWLLADLLGGRVEAAGFLLAWRSLFRFSVFFLTAWLLARLKGAEDRRRLFERIFFHDILNLVGAIRGYAELLEQDQIRGDREIFHTMYAGANQIIEQIETQRMVAAAQNRELRVNAVTLHSGAFLRRQVQLYREAEIVRGSRLEVAPDTCDVPFESDPVLLGRVLGNMLKNALEATDSSGTVTIGCDHIGDEIVFWVHNPGHIPSAVQGRIFQPDFSTKGMGRGLGTYGMQLLTRYLKGRITFSSSPEGGTVFRARYPLKKFCQQKTHRDSA